MPMFIHFMLNSKSIWVCVIASINGISLAATQGIHPQDKNMVQHGIGLSELKGTVQIWTTLMCEPHS